jgi:peroxiredoxin
MKRIILLVLLACVLAAIGILGVKIVRGAAEKEAIAARIHTLPAFQFFTLDHTPFSNATLSAGKPVVVMHFLTTCHFCQGEAKEFAKHPSLLAGAQVLMISMEGAATLAAFRREYGLDALPNVMIVSDSLKTFNATFGTLATPTTFIYDAERNLVKQFTGETSAKAILNAIVATGYASEK